jgi:allantoinase
MGDFDLLLRGCSVVVPGRVVEADVAVADGILVAVAAGLDGRGTVEIDARGLTVMPGCVDPHVHLNDPGTDWEGFDTGTAAFASGGGTCLFDMPLNALPPTLDGASFDLKLEAARDRAHVDFCLWGGLVPGNVDRLDELAARGVVGFKAFMCDSGRDEFPFADDLTLHEGMSRAARLGLPVAVHAESQATTAALARCAREHGRTAMRDYVESRPVRAELEAVGRAIAIAEETDCALHVVHVSTAAAALCVAEAYSRGVDVSCETCPHYLLLTDEDAERIGALAKCSPPIRPRAAVEELWGAIHAGSIAMLASDHSPAPPELKRGDDAFAWWGGISGLQTLRGTMLAVANEQGLSLPDLARLTAEAAAARFSLTQKGRLEVGCDADLTVIDLSYEGRVETVELRYRYRQSPFVGLGSRGRLVHSFLRGKSLIVDARPAAGKGFGRIVRPD